MAAVNRVRCMDSSMHSRHVHLHMHLMCTSSWHCSLSLTSIFNDIAKLNHDAGLHYLNMSIYTGVFIIHMEVMQKAKETKSCKILTYIIHTCMQCKALTCAHGFLKHTSTWLVEVLTTLRMEYACPLHSG
jgi:hypothetical protein